MDIIIHDTLSAMLAMQDLPVRERPDALRAMLAPMPMPPGGDIVAMHHHGGGFRVDSDDPRYAAALHKLIEADLPGRIEHHLREALGHLKAHVPDIRHADPLQVMFVLGDPDNEHLRRFGGYYGMGATPGWLYLIAWPSDEVIDKIPHCAVHEFHHNVRYANVEWNPMTVTVGEYVISEGLAEAFVREISGERAMGPWSRAATGEDLTRARDKIIADVGVTGMHRLTAYVLGDTTARGMGQEPAGVPDMGGYAVGLEIVDAHLAASGLTVAASTVLPARQILANAGIGEPVAR